MPPIRQQNKYRIKYALDKFFSFPLKGKVYEEVNFDSIEISDLSLNKIYNKEMKK